jgi:hypothetical protein
MKAFLFIIVCAFVFTQCTAQVKDSSKMQKKPIEQVLNENRDTLMAIPDVQGFFQGETENGNECIVIMIDSLTAENKGKFPDSLGGYPVKVEVSGKIKPLNQDSKKPSPQK